MKMPTQSQWLPRSSCIVASEESREATQDYTVTVYASEREAQSFLGVYV
jgi:hypothetical protein